MRIGVCVREQDENMRKILLFLIFLILLINTKSGTAGCIPNVPTYNVVVNTSCVNQNFSINTNVTVADGVVLNLTNTNITNNNFQNFWIVNGSGKIILDASSNIFHDITSFIKDNDEALVSLFLIMVLLPYFIRRKKRKKKALEVENDGE